METNEFRTPKSERTFENVLQTATQLFAEKGYHQTTMRDIGQASGVRAGALYYYCRSKEELVLKFYERLNREVIEAFRAQADAPSVLPEAVATFLRLKLQRFAPYRSLLRVVMKEAIDPESPLSPLHSGSSETLDLSVGLFREMVERNHAARGEEIEAMARALWLAHIGVLAYWLHDRSEDFQATDRAIETLSGLLRLSDRLTRIPGMGRLRSQLFTLVSALFPSRNTPEPASPDNSI
jgi:AcrR family transcriptional regulator